MIFNYEPGQTPIDAAEADALIPPLTTQAELNEWEEQDIFGGRRWAFSKRVLNKVEPLSEEFLFELRRKMFDNTWKWAGKIRTRDKNIGVPFYKIRVYLRELLDDARYWRDNRTYDFDEFAMRFHHRLVQNSFVLQWQWPPRAACRRFYCAEERSTGLHLGKC